MYPAASSAVFRLPSYRFTHRTVGEMYEKIIRAGIHIGQLPIKICISTFSRRGDVVESQSHKFDYSHEQYDLIENFIYENCEIIHYFHIDFRGHSSNLHDFTLDLRDYKSPSFFDYTVCFDKTDWEPSGTIKMSLDGTQVNGFLLRGLP